MRYLKLYEQYRLDDHAKDSLEFIKLVIDTKGKSDAVLQGNIDRTKYLPINDTIDGDYIEDIWVIGIISNNKSIFIYDYPFDKLIALCQYLKKKYPELAVGKEWGFFDLEGGSK